MNKLTGIYDKSLAKYPPKLKNLAKFITDSPDYMSISEYAKAAGMNVDSIYVLISRSRKKGNDFYDLVHDIIKEKLRVYRPKVFKALIDKALEGDVQAAKLFFQLSGDLQPGSGGDRNVIINQINMPVATNAKAPIDLQKKWERDRAELDKYTESI